jgi:hypothetical protein
MAEKPESSPTKIWHILIPAATTVLVALIGLFTAVYQTEKPIQLTAAALSVTQTAGATIQPTRAVQATGLPGTPVQASLPAKTDVPARTATLPANSIQIRNDLARPVIISINSVDQGELQDGGVKTYRPNRFPASLSWSEVKQTTEKGTPLGHEMGGAFQNIAVGDEITLDNLVENQPYFYPIITNLTNMDCEVTINKGWKSESITHAVSSAKTDRVGFGYYELYTNSNLVLDCAGQVYWWGTLPDEVNPNSFFEDVEKGSGVVEFTLKP